MQRSSFYFIFPYIFTFSHFLILCSCSIPRDVYVLGTTAVVVHHQRENHPSCECRMPPSAESVLPKPCISLIYCRRYDSKIARMVFSTPTTRLGKKPQRFCFLFYICIRTCIYILRAPFSFVPVSFWPIPLA